MDLNKFENANDNEKIIIIDNLINNYNELKYDEYINIIKYININYNIINLDNFLKRISLLSIAPKLLNLINPNIIDKNNHSYFKENKNYEILKNILNDDFEFLISVFARYLSFEGDEQYLFFFSGSGSNGKSFFNEI